MLTSTMRVKNYRQALLEKSLRVSKKRLTNKMKEGSREDTLRLIESRQLSNRTSVENLLRNSLEVLLKETNMKESKDGAAMS